MLTDADGLSRLYERIASTLRCRVPQRDFVQLADELVASEKKVIVLRGFGPPPNRAQAIRARLMKALEHPDVRWRSPKALAAEAGISGDDVAAILLADSDVRFSRNKRGGVIIGLTRRVGERKIKKKDRARSGPVTSE
jgi:1,6-anhydro-N-acetylmuramate kinase